jgi:hypothetical protein
VSLWKAGSCAISTRLSFFDHTRSYLPTHSACHRISLTESLVRATTQTGGPCLTGAKAGATVFVMMRFARVALVVVAIFSLAFVLITPDRTDDVDGVLRPNYSAKAPRIVSLPLPQSPILVIVPSLLSMPWSATQRLTTSELRDLGCVCRC